VKTVQIDQKGAGAERREVVESEGDGDITNVPKDKEDMRTADME
jgi:hypothetical protein